MTAMMLTAALASKFATLALSHVTRAYPNKMDHVLNGPADVLGPREVHPIFYGSFDWHSCVHGYWLLARLYREHPSLLEGPRIRDLFHGQFTPANVAAEVEYLAQPNRGTFERPYGWAWLLMLAGELAKHTSGEGKRWAAQLHPLAAAFAQRFVSFLPRATYPIRAGTHFNTAFAIALALDYATAIHDDALASLLRAKAVAWYGDDADCQCWEPGGDDFLSPALIEAECMRRALGPGAFDNWFRRFLPKAERGHPATLFTPATVSDRADGKIAHLDGLNLSRAWCWRAIASTWTPDDPRRSLAIATADRHLAASLPYVAGDYAGEHWLATYAVLALTA
jgi:DUF2891 family protein